MAINSIPRRENVFDAAEYNFGNLKKLENPKIAQAFQQDGVKGVLSLLATDSEFVRKQDEPLEARLIRAAGRNAMAAFDDLGHVVLGATEALAGGLIGGTAAIVAMFDSLPEAAWIAIHAASNGGEAFKRLNSAVEEMRKEGKWTAHESLWAENKEAIQRNWQSIKDQASWSLASGGFECFVTGLARAAYTGPSAVINAGQAVAQTGAAVGVAVGRPIGIVILEILHLAKPLGWVSDKIGDFFKAAGAELHVVGQDAHDAAKELAKNTIWAEIPGMGAKPAGKGVPTFA